MASNKRKPRIKDAPGGQYARFVQTAKEAEADESPDAMDKALRKIKVTTARPSAPRPRPSAKRSSA
jgi:hypothetical protein